LEKRTGRRLHSSLIFSICILLLINLLAIPISLWRVLFSPGVDIILSVVVFLIGAFAMFCIEISFIRNRLLLFGKGLSEKKPGILLLKRPLAMLLKVMLWMTVILGIISFCVLAFGGVVKDLPVFAERADYLIYDQAKDIEVSHLKYFLIGSCFFITSHLMALFLTVYSLYWIMFGEKSF